MARYHFQTFHGLDFDLDGTGVEVANAAAAERMAIRAAGDAIRNLSTKMTDGSIWSMRVVDENDNAITHLSFSVTRT